MMKVLLTLSETVGDYYNYCQEMCLRIVKNESSKPIGGGMFYGGSEFGKRKYQKGEISGRAAGFRGHFLGNHTSIFVPV